VDVITNTPDNRPIPARFKLTITDSMFLEKLLRYLSVGKTVYINRFTKEEFWGAMFTITSPQEGKLYKALKEIIDKHGYVDEYHYYRVTPREHVNKAAIKMA
jgi:hypothetical protein